MRTDRPFYAQNARQLLDNRRIGVVPADPVVVALSGGSFPGHVTLLASADLPAERMDWSMLVNLSVWVLASAKVPLRKVIDAVYRIALARPKELVLRFEHGEKVHDVEVGYGHHLPAVADCYPVHQFQWCPINVGGTGLGRRLKKALLSKKPDGEKL